MELPCNILKLDGTISVVPQIGRTNSRTITFGNCSSWCNCIVLVALCLKTNGRSKQAQHNLTGMQHNTANMDV